jgi:hypothetical protein
MEESSIIKEAKEVKAEEPPKPTQKVVKRRSQSRDNKSKDRSGSRDKPKPRSTSRDRIKPKPMAQNERKLQEADQYLRRLHEKQLALQRPEFEGDLSELSQWTNDQANIKPVLHPAAQYKSLPEKERLLEDILVLRQTRNINEEQIKIMKI